MNYSPEIRLSVQKHFMVTLISDFLESRTSIFRKNFAGHLKKHRFIKNKRILGRSIEERPASVNDRKEFGHWEADLVIGSKNNNDDALLTMIERKTREYWMIRIPGRDPNGVMNALSTVRSQFEEHWNDIFKTITIDNGSEFSTLSDLETLSKTLVYFAHPYTSCEKGSVERHNGLIRRFIPKGKRNRQLFQ